MADNFSDRNPGLDSPASNAFSITPNDSTDLSIYTRGIYIGVTGDINLDTVDGTTLVFKNVPVGILPVRAKRIRATSTTATELIGLY